MSKTYIGTRNANGCQVTVHDGGRVAVLPLRLDLANKSPTGFEWGYGGSGPAQLALALLADCLGNDRHALKLHQHFKFSVIGSLKGDRFRLTDTEIRTWCREYWTNG